MADSRQAETGKALFEIWERHVANYFDELFRHPAFLKTMGATLDQSLAWQQQVEALGEQLVGPFASRSDQSRILSELEALRGEVAVLARQVEKLSQAVAALQSPAAPPPGEPKRRSPRRARPVVDPDES